MNKNLTDTEIDNLLTANIHIYPIFQETNSSIDAFTYEKGVKDGTKAFTQATTFKFPQGSISLVSIMSSDRYNLLRTEKAKIFNKNPDTNKIAMDGCCQSYAEWMTNQVCAVINAKKA